MNDYISNVIARNLNPVEDIQPRPVSLFEPLVGAGQAHSDYFYGSHKLAEEETTEDAIAEAGSTDQIPMTYSKKLSNPARVYGSLSRRQVDEIPVMNRGAHRSTERQNPLPVPEMSEKHRPESTPTSVMTKDGINDQAFRAVSASQFQSRLDASSAFLAQARIVSSDKSETVKDTQPNDIERHEIVSEGQNREALGHFINRIVVEKPADSFKAQARMAEDKANIEPKKSADKASQLISLAPTALENVRSRNNQPFESPHKQISVSETDKEVNLKLPEQEIHAEVEPRSIGADHTSTQAAPIAVVAYPQVQPYVQSEIQKPYKHPSIDGTPHTVNVTIGCIEVRAVPAEKESVKKERRMPPVMSLDEYMRQRAGKSNR